MGRSPFPASGFLEFFLDCEKGRNQMQFTEICDLIEILGIQFFSMIA